MTIAFHLCYKGKTGKAIKFMQEMEVSGIAKLIRSKKGNLKHDYFMPFNKTDEILLIDCWDSEESLLDYQQSEIYQKTLALCEKYDLIVTLEKYERM